MTLPPAPPFDPDKNKNQHHVPQLWQQRFANSAGRVYGRYRAEADPIRERHPRRAGKARQVNVAKTMAADWIYTVFDRWWRPSNALEAALSKDEGRIAYVYDQVADPAAPISAQIRLDLCQALGLAACRTPEVMGRGHRRAKELAWAAAEVHSHADKAAYFAAIRSKFGVELTEEDYDKFRSRTTKQLLEEASWIEGLSPQAPELPEQIALLGAGLVGNIMESMQLTLLQAPDPLHFVLGDTPLPDAGLIHGFIVPISASVALQAETPEAAPKQSVRRRIASVQEVEMVNIQQYDMCRDVIIGPDPAVLDAF
ncbi:DUF4238 domain-containing protein [Methylorubrum thiocyanatum]|uniref:DUF4238 domain-containing protein n=1 Tax=Methylorubrum thiocyanatum TaxID=47958 RepID=UPI00398C2E5B